MTGQRARLDATSLAGQMVLYAVLAMVLVRFSKWPVYHQIAPDQALIKLSIVHEPQLIQPCRQRTRAELEELPPNMRAPMLCERARAALVAEVDVDGRQVLRQVAQPSGLARDGRATLYHRLVTTAGRHEIAVRLRDQAGDEGFNHRAATPVELRPSQVLVIDFDRSRGGIIFR